MIKHREKEIIEGVIKILQKYLNVSRVIFFGSRAKAINETCADFDFAVDCARPDISVQRKINEEIENVSGLYKVDVVYLNSADKEFQKIVLKTGRVVYEKRD